MTALKLKATKILPPLEREDQQSYFAWLFYQRYQGIRVWEMAYAIPNGSFLAGSPAKRAIQGKQLRLQGVKAGVPDICIAIPVAPYSGLYIELKRIGAPKPGDDQSQWHTRLRAQGYFVAVCHGLKAAIAITNEYFHLEHA
jgi:hypothetical protein